MGGTTHENANIDMIADRIVNRLMAGTKELPDPADVARVLKLVAPDDGSYADDYCAKRHAKYEASMKLLDELLKIPIIEQKSDEWLRVRQTIVTASDFAQALGDGKFGTQVDFLLKKSGYKDIPFDGNCAPLKWGVMFEDVAGGIYEKRNGIKILPFGLIKHPTCDHFGASPDGITTLGVMVEIKCPFKRKITNEVPLQYYYQIQGQLDVCGLDECDFLECEFKKVARLEDLRGMHDAREIGCIYELPGTKYKYSPICSSDDAGHDALSAWIASEAPPSGEIIETNLWYLDRLNVIRVYRDPDFIERKMAELAKVWGRVVAYRNDRDLYEHEIGDLSAKAVKKANLAASRALTSGIKTTAAGFVSMSGYGFLDDGLP